jgi:hypothetical protein
MTPTALCARMRAPQRGARRVHRRARLRRLHQRARPWRRRAPARPQTGVNGNRRRAHKIIVMLCNRYLPMLCNGHLPKVTECDPDFHKCPKLEERCKKEHKEGPVPPTWGAGGPVPSPPPGGAPHHRGPTPATPQGRETPGPSPLRSGVRRPGRNHLCPQPR